VDVRQTIQIKRVYDPATESDGYRILVDRVWPRGLSKRSAAVDLWLRDVAPTASLRKWFGHRPDRWQEFKRRYRRELDHEASSALAELRSVQRAHITLLYAAKDKEHNNAVALLEHLTTVPH
jgi:uncharacterized protein YeaO (DUF488 family)